MFFWLLFLFFSCWFIFLFEWRRLLYLSSWFIDSWSSDTYNALINWLEIRESKSWRLRYFFIEFGVMSWLILLTLVCFFDSFDCFGVRVVGFKILFFHWVLTFKNLLLFMLDTLFFWYLNNIIFKWMSLLKRWLFRRFWDLIYKFYFCFWYFLLLKMNFRFFFPWTRFNRLVI